MESIIHTEYKRKQKVTQKEDVPVMNENTQTFTFYF